MDNKFLIPDNYNDNSQFVGVPYRNLAEGIIFGGLMVVLTWQIPFIITIKITIALIVFVVNVIIFSIGVRSESMTQFLFATIKFVINKRRLHLQVTGKGVNNKNEKKSRFSLKKNAKENSEDTINDINSESAEQ